MSNPASNEVVNQKMIRGFTQRGGARPGNRIRYAGADEQLLMIGDISNPVRGGITPNWVHDPYRRGAYRNIGNQVDPPDFPTATITFKKDNSAISWLSGELTCPVTLYELEGLCGNPSDFRNGWTTAVRILSEGLAGSRTHQGRTSFGGDDDTMDEVEFTFLGGVYELGALRFSAKAISQVSREVVDITYGIDTECGDCGPSNDGTQQVYALTKSSGSGSPGLPAEVIYTTDGWLTQTETDISGLGATTDPVAIKVVGNYLVVLSPADNGYYYAEINRLTSVPGTFSLVTTGFDTNHKPRDMYVASPREVFFAGDGGYIYRATDIPSGVSTMDAGDATTTDLNRIHGSDDTLIAVGDSGVVIKSADRGENWATTTAALSGTLQAIWVQDDYRYWAGNSAGTVSQSQNGGETWTTETMPGSINGVFDIVFATTEVGYIAATSAGPVARLLTTYDGGESWISSATTSPRMPTFPVADRPNRLAVPFAGAFTAANNIAIAGLAGDGLDGFILMGIAGVK